MILLYHLSACFTEAGSSRFKRPGRNFISLFLGPAAGAKSQNWNKRTFVQASPTWLNDLSIKRDIVIHADMWIEDLVSSISSRQLRWGPWENETAPFNIVLHKQSASWLNVALLACPVAH